MAAVGSCCLLGRGLRGGATGARGASPGRRADRAAHQGCMEGEGHSSGSF